MNILFFVSSLLIILTFVVSSFFSSTLSLESEKTSLLGLMEARKKTRDMWQVRLFNSATKNVTPKQGLENKIPKVITNYQSHRVISNKCRLSKINLHFLFETDYSHKKELITICENLLNELYGKKSFIKELNKEHWPKDLLKQMISFGAKKKGDLDLLDLMPDTPEQSYLFYKILKGSCDYDLEKGSGYPPLSDFFYIDSKERYPIYFCYASSQVLKACLGRALCSEVIREEKKKSLLYGGRRVLTKQELKSLIENQRAKQKDLLWIDEIFTFSKRSTTLEALQYKDEKSNVRYSLPLKS